MADPQTIRTTIPSRLDALPWSRWHTRVVIALGIAWLLDGLEVTLVGSLGGVLQRSDTLGLSETQIGLAASAYVGGTVAGALFFGKLADRMGRKRLFLVTLTVYVIASILTGASFDFLSFALCRALAGFGIGGEYAAINSAIDELIPARVRGVTALAINGTFWIGAALGAALSVVLLDPRLLGPEAGWRAAFYCGAALAVAILLVRRHVPESPRWLVTHGRADRAEAEVARIEAQALGTGSGAPGAHDILAVRLRRHVAWDEVLRILVYRYRSRTVLGLSLMAAQAFFYNAIFFTYGMVLTRFHGVPEERVGAWIVPFALANFAGPLALGWLFDSAGRRIMIASTYVLSGIGLLAAGYAFVRGWLDVTGQTAAWAVIFFFASAAASSAYLTVSEVFPTEMRAVAISIFYAVGTGIGGFAAPAFFAWLIQSGSREALFWGYAVSAALMCAAAVVAAVAGVDAERKPLEAVARPLSSI